MVHHDDVISVLIAQMRSFINELDDVTAMLYVHTEYEKSGAHAHGGSYQ